jgi:hypothetical protein
MPKCKNDPTRTYKGTEPSPKGNGYCAHAETLGAQMKGADGKMWYVTQTKQGVKRWSKVSAPSLNANPTQAPAPAATNTAPSGTKIPSKWLTHYTSDQKSLIRKLSKSGSAFKALTNVGIHVFVRPVHINQSLNQYIIDEAFEDVPLEYHSSSGELAGQPYMVVILRINADNKLYLPNGNLQIHQGNLKGKNKKSALEILNTQFKDRVQWNGRNTQAIRINIKD